MSRIPTIDNLKTTGIFLVVLGHTHYFGFINEVIYAFHMPLFFLISGFLVRAGSLKNSLPLAIRKLVPKYLIPYFFYATIGYLFWAISATLFSDTPLKNTQIYQPILGTLYGTGTPDEVRVKPIVLWFLPCLMSTHIIFRLILTYCRKFYLLASGLIAGVGFHLPSNIVLPMELETALVTQFFIALGYFFHSLKYSRPKYRYLHQFGSILLLLLGIMLVWGANTHVDVRSSQFGNPFWFLLAALSLSLACALLLSLIPANRLCQFISRNTLIIFALHLLLLACMNQVSTACFPSHPPILNHLGIAFSASIMICLALAWLGDFLRCTLPEKYRILYG